MDDTIRSAYGKGRLTKPRATIAVATSTMRGAFTVEDLADRVREGDPSAGATATVYRAVTAMESAGFLERVGTRAGSALYARCGAHSHHHHIVCDGCGRIAHTECPIETKVATERADGFVITRHEVTLYGICPACAEKDGGS